MLLRHKDSGLGWIDSQLQQLSPTLWPHSRRCPPTLGESVVKSGTPSVQENSREPPLLKKTNKPPIGPLRTSYTRVLFALRAPSAINPTATLAIWRSQNRQNHIAEPSYIACELPKHARQKPTPQPHNSKTLTLDPKSPAKLTTCSCVLSEAHTTVHQGAPLPRAQKHQTFMKPKNQKAQIPGSRKPQAGPKPPKP